MLLIHQTGSVCVGEVVRYTVTYTPSLDRILPSPAHLHVKIKNTSAIPLRAAYLHGPYTLYTACYPSTFNPNKRHVTSKEEGDPDYEPQLKAGGTWSSKLTVPRVIREDGGNSEHKEGQPRKSFTWIIEVASQVLFSTTARVHFELIIGRDEKSINFGFTGVAHPSGAPGRLEDHEMGVSKSGHHIKGVFTKAIHLKVEDTASLWDSPMLPSYDGVNHNTAEPPRVEQTDSEEVSDRPKKKQKKIHLVVITHGLHSNLGADMLYLKESIDVTAKQAKEDAKNARRIAKEQESIEKQDFGRKAVNERAKSAPEVILSPTPTFSNDQKPEDKDEDDGSEEEVVVKGFKGNAVRTERGIQYLGKRLAKYVLAITYPDQPYLPVKSTITQSISRTFTGAPKPTQQNGKHPTHKHSSIAKDENSSRHDLPYQITSISFVGHSLGGLIQTYAIAYIQKHSPEFFDKITPINFVALASPFLGLSNENPMYVKFALDFGLVGRTGQDLGLTWRAPTIARSGWGAMVGGFSTEQKTEENPGAKPLLRILPTGPAHIAMKRFRNRSVYSNVVNDGIVPLRTSCLLFLDWRGLGRVEKARRENGLVGTMVNWGLSELTGQNASTPRRGIFEDFFSDSGDETNRTAKNATDPGASVPQAEATLGLDDDTTPYNAGDENEPRQSQALEKTKSPVQRDTPNFWSSLTSFFRPHAGKQQASSTKQQKIFMRGQTMSHEDMEEAFAEETAKEESMKSGQSSPSNHRKLLVRGSSLYTNASDNESLDAPPRTTVFESAGDLLNPPLPPKEFLLDPEARPRTIFHDRVYHPEDIPPPPTKRQRTLMRTLSGSSKPSDVPNQDPQDLQRISTGKSQDLGTMKIEEKIARAYHKDMAWRKVLVRLEPDAHNNIIVRRMFANAYGWPVVKHMCDTHFGYTTAARTRDEDEEPVERAKPRDTPATKDGEEVKDQTQLPEQHDDEDKQRSISIDNMPDKDDHEVDTLHARQRNLQESQKLETSKPRDARTVSELRESRDQITDLVSMVSAQGEPSQSYSTMHSGTAALHRLNRQDSARWSDRFFDSSEDEEDDDENELNAEWQKAYDRGPRDFFSGASPRSARSSHSSKAGPRRSSKPLLPESDAGSRLFAEPEDMSRRSSLRSEISDAAPEPQLLSMTGVGLGRNVQNIAEEINEGSTSGGISEQVAQSRSSGKQEEDDDERVEVNSKPAVDQWL